MKNGDMKLADFIMDSFSGVAAYFYQ